MYRNHYRCEGCQVDWTDDYEGECDTDCPTCGQTTRPSKSAQLVELDCFTHTTQNGLKLRVTTDSHGLTVEAIGYNETLIVDDGGGEEQPYPTVLFNDEREDIMEGMFFAAETPGCEQGSHLYLTTGDCPVCGSSCEPEYRAGVPGILVNRPGTSSTGGVQRCPKCRAYPSNLAALERLISLGRGTRQAERVWASIQRELEPEFGAGI